MPRWERDDARPRSGVSLKKIVFGFMVCLAFLGGACGGTDGSGSGDEEGDDEVCVPVDMPGGGQDCVNDEPQPQGTPTAKPAYEPQPQPWRVESIQTLPVKVEVKR